MDVIAPTQRAIDELKQGKHWEDIAHNEPKNPLGMFLMNEIYAGGISIGAASELAGLNRATLYKILNGDTRPSRNVLIRLSRVLGMNIEKTQKLLKDGECAPLSGSKTEDLILMYGIINNLSLGDMDADLTRNGFASLFQK